jgi:hypothetical protein
MSEETITTLEEIKAELRREGAIEALNKLLVVVEGLKEQSVEAGDFFAFGIVSIYIKLRIGELESPK